MARSDFDFLLVCVSFVSLLQEKTKRNERSGERKQKKKKKTHKPQGSILSSAQITADLSRICPPVSRPQPEEDCYYSEKTGPAQSFTACDLAETLPSALDDTPTTAAEVLLRQSWRIAMDITGPAHIP